MKARTIHPNMISAGDRPMRIWRYRGWCWMCRLDCNAPARTGWGLPDQQEALTYGVRHLLRWHRPKPCPGSRLCAGADAFLYDGRRPRGHVLWPTLGPVNYPVTSYPPTATRPVYLAHEDAWTALETPLEVAP